MPDISAGMQRLIRCWYARLPACYAPEARVLKKKAAEPGREALAAFKFVGARRLVTCIAVTFGSAQALR